MINYILGSVELCIKENRGLGILASNNISCYDLRFCDDKFIFNIPLYLLNKAKKVLNENGVEIVNISFKGLPQIIFTYRKRLGLIAGLIIFCVAVWLSPKYIWMLNIKGNNTVSEETIISILDELGCGVGDKISDINFDEIHNSFLIKCDDISWISVNMDGVIANVEVKETRRGNLNDDVNYNVIASEDGQVELITVVKGKPQVEIGDVVRKGDLLISGVESYREGANTFYRSADGIIIAKVNRLIKVEVNESKNVRVKTGQVQKRKSIKIFNFVINLFRNGGIVYEEYDIITENRQIYLFGVIKLPVWVYTETISEVYLDYIKLSEEEMRAEAISNYKTMIASLSFDSELVSITTKSGLENGVFFIESNIYCLADIAEKVPYDIAE